MLDGVLGLRGTGNLGVEYLWQAKHEIASSVLLPGEYNTNEK